MKLQRDLGRRLDQYVDSNQDRLIEITRDLVQIPSENTPPTGNERACQEYVAGFLKGLDWEPDVYELDQVEGLEAHPLFWPGRDYSNRPNVSVRNKGLGGGRSLILSGHIDTVPIGTQLWSHDPFGGDVEKDRLYGRGSNDMKAGVGTSLFVVEALHELGFHLDGDLTIESVVDEEFGGVNGTLAGRVKGYHADAAIIGEPTFLKVCPAQRGGHFAHITFASPGGILQKGGESVSVVDQVRQFLVGVKEFADQRRRTVQVHELYSDVVDPVPVLVTRIFTGPWGSQEPIGIPETCKIELYWQAMPGEAPQEVQAQFESWLKELVEGAPELFSTKPVVESPLRCLPASAIPSSSPLVQQFVACAAETLGEEPPVVGMEAPCDMYVFHEFGIPALLWGPKGANTHTVDEYVEIDSLLHSARVLLRFVCGWCGAS